MKLINGLVGSSSEQRWGVPSPMVFAHTQRDRGLDPLPWM